MLQLDMVNKTRTFDDGISDNLCNYSNHFPCLNYRMTELYDISHSQNS